MTKQYRTVYPVLYISAPILLCRYVDLVRYAQPRRNGILNTNNPEKGKQNLSSPYKNKTKQKGKYYVFVVKTKFTYISAPINLKIIFLLGAVHHSHFL